MSAKTVPPLVVWLVTNVGCNLDNDAVVGDLVQYLHQGRSIAWIWKQAIVSIVVSFFAQLRRQPLTILRGVTAGWLIYWPLGYIVFHFGFYELALVSLDLDNPDLLIGSWAPPIWYHTAHFGRIYTFAANAIATGAMVGIALFSGMGLSRLFRPSARPVLLAFSATVLLSWVFYSFTLGDQAIGARLPWSAYFWMNTIVQVLGILIGGHTDEARRVVEVR